jgi:hypothetical protein
MGLSVDTEPSSWIDKIHEIKDIMVVFAFFMGSFFPRPFSAAQRFPLSCSWKNGSRGSACEPFSEN